MALDYSSNLELLMCCCEIGEEVFIRNIAIGLIEFKSH